MAKAMQKAKKNIIESYDYLNQVSEINEIQLGKIMHMAGLARRAGVLIFGSVTICDSMRKYAPYSLRYKEEFSGEEDIIGIINSDKTENSEISQELYATKEVKKVKEKISPYMPKLVLEASDTSENSRKKLNDKCKYYSVYKVRLPLTMAQIGEYFGKSSSVSALAIADENFFRAIAGLLKSPTES